MSLLDLFIPGYCHICKRESVALLCDDCRAKIFPIEEYCQKCGKPLDSDVIPRCTAEICAMDRKIGYFFDYARSAVYLNDVVTTIIHEFKYRGRKGLFKVFEKYLSAVAKEIIEKDRIDMVVPVPMHWKKRLRRPYNQAEVIASFVSSEFGLRYVRGLRRLRNTKMQAGMDYAQRQTNVRGAFKTAKKIDFSEKNVLLVDDILTTGYTVNECSRELKKAGANKVIILTLARH